jgi:serine/threonine protein kinase
MPRRDETPRDLLFGLLALQVGLIDQEQLLAAFGFWSRNKGKALAEILVERGAIDAESRSLLSGMAEKQLKLHGGDAEKSLAAVAVGPSTREKLAAMGDSDLTESVGLLGPPVEMSDPYRTASHVIGTSTSDGQRFRILRPHAQGGLGAVFVALDGELNREVALKQILDQHADSESSRTRFMIEAEITGGLEHPGIVPVYGLGHDGDGRPYYAMRFIRGDSLKEAIAAFHSDESLKRDPGKRSLALRKLLRRFGDVCNAIDYAHGRGILHRDLKPGNVIVGKHGETLVVDWGLAKAMGRAEVRSDTGERTLMPSSASGSAATLHGSALGTPAYMSPEQAAGDLDKLGPRSDVYSLGATLYCLLTGKPAFEGTKIGEMLRDVQKGTFPPPCHVDPSIDKALEAVCLKAMATSPAGRYASAHALAEDLERWSADEPVSAWREPWARRARRWARRNRSLVTAASAAVLMAVVGLSAVLAVQARANTALDAKNRALDRANTDLRLANERETKANTDLRESNRQKDEANSALAGANVRVQARFELARDAIRTFKSGVEQDETLKEDRLKPLRDKLLGSARQFYDRLGALLEGQADAASKAVLAESYLELGELIDLIGQRPEALAAFKKAVAIRRELAAAPGAGPSERVELARALNDQGLEAQVLNDHAGGLAAHEEARALVEPLANGPGATLAARRALGFAHHGAAMALETTGKTLEALAAYRRAREVRELLARDPAAVPADRLQLAYSISNVGGLLAKTGDNAGAMAEHRKSQELRRALVAESPAGTHYRADLAVSYSWIGGLLESTGDTAGAMAEFRKYQDLMRALVAERPAVSQYRRELAVSHSRIGDLLRKAGARAEAMAEFRKHQELMRVLVAESPTVADYRRELALCSNKIALILESTGDNAEALVERRRGLEIRQSLVDESPAIPMYRRDLAVSHGHVGNLLEAFGDTAGALAEFRKTQDLLRALVAEDPGAGSFRGELAICNNRIGALLEAAGDTVGAMAEFRKFQDLMRALAAESPAAAQYRHGLAASHYRVGGLLWKTGDTSGALAEQDQARTFLEALVAANPNAAEYRNWLAAVLISGGDALRDLGRLDEARDRYARAIAVREALAAGDPKAAAYRSGPADGLRKLATLKLAAGDAAGASADARRAVGLYEGLPSRPGVDWFGLGCARATLSAAEAPELAARAMADLRQAVAKGYRNPAEYRREPALDPLRGRDDFRVLMLDLAFPSDVFAR